MLREGEFEACNPRKSRESYQKQGFYLFLCLDKPSASKIDTFLTSVKMIFIYSEHIRKCSKLQIMIVFPVLIPVQNFLFPGTGRENLKCYGKGRDGKFEACIPGNHGKREFPLTPGLLK